MKIALTQGRLIDPRHQRDEIQDLYLADGRVVGIGQAPDGYHADQTLDARGLVVCPGLIDLDAHIAPLDSELRAAVAGGVTTLVCPPDMDPILDEPELADRLVRRIADQQLARVLPLGALTLGLGGERLSEMAGLRKAGCIAFSQANRPITDTQSLLRALEYAASFNFPVWLQPQDYYLGRGGVAHDGEVANRLGLAGIPVSAETIAIATLLTLAADVGVRLHLSHISSAAGIAMIASAQEEGIPVSCDVTIHHLHLSEHDIGFFDTNARFAPPLRSLRDRDGLRRAAAHGVASLCSNHSPHGRDHKLLPFDEAAPGSTGLELLLPLTLKWAAAEKLPLATALARLTSDPARILGRDDLGHLGLGATADVCLFDPEAEWQVSAENLQSRGKNTAFLGYPLTGRVRQTLVAGRPVLPA